MLSTALNSNAINVMAGLLVPASLTGLGARSGQDLLVAGWYAGLTVLALAFAYRDRGLGRMPGAVIIAGYLAFVTALAISVTQAGVSPAAACSPPARSWRPVPCCWPGRPAGARRAARPEQAWLAGRRKSLVRGWTAGRCGC